MKVYGLTTCRQTQKAMAWLRAQNIAFDFHDFKKAGITREKLLEWHAKLGFESFLNKKGSAWRELEDSIKSSVVTSEDAIGVMLGTPRTIKRPAIEDGAFLYFGFDQEFYEKHFSKP